MKELKLLIPKEQNPYYIQNNEMFDIICNAIIATAITIAIRINAIAIFRAI